MNPHLVYGMVVSSSPSVYVYGMVVSSSPSMFVYGMVAFSQTGLPVAVGRMFIWCKAPC